jgi:hypothetical protein
MRNVIFVLGLAAREALYQIVMKSSGAQPAICSLDANNNAASVNGRWLGGGHGCKMKEVGPAVKRSRQRDLS